jgi:hypothetical protein
MISKIVERIVDAIGIIVIMPILVIIGTIDMWINKNKEDE